MHAWHKRGWRHRASPNAAKAGCVLCLCRYTIEKPVYNTPVTSHLQSVCIRCYEQCENILKTGYSGLVATPLPFSLCVPCVHEFVMQTFCEIELLYCMYYSDYPVSVFPRAATICIPQRKGFVDHKLYRAIANGLEHSDASAAPTCRLALIDRVMRWRYLYIWVNIIHVV